jgi:glycosyltransferase involved in cell wall biosynthesis
MTPIRLLTFSTLYPNAARPNHGVFVENRLRHLVATGEASATVLAPVPYFPSKSALFGQWGKFAEAPMEEQRHGLTVHHPRYLVIPRFGMTLAPSLLYRASLAALRRTGAAFDLIDAHYLYPDGVAAIRLGAALNRPVVLTARGSDVTQLPDFALPRRLIRDAIARAAGLIAVSDALRGRLLDLGADPERTVALRNGVDTEMFRPVDRQAARAALAVSGKVLVSVGALIDRKGHHRTIEAMQLLTGCTLLIAGEGPERPRLRAQIEALNLSNRVHLLGAMPHERLATLYGAADAMILASSREGWANVLLEAMACGTPVVASDIPGNPEVVRAPEAGVIVANTPRAIADGTRRLLAAPPSRAATRAYAERHGWAETSAGQLALFRAILGRASG